MSDPHRQRILARRARLVAAAVAGLGGLGASGCGRCNPMVCLEPPPAPATPAAPTGATRGSAASPTPATKQPSHQTVTGEAQNGKAGAVVIVDGGPIYVQGLDAWPDAWLGQQVEVSGTLIEYQGLDPQAAREMQGIVGTYQVLERSTWRRLP
jgi:hypothetical protein